jgi:hypothetical protein
MTLCRGRRIEGPNGVAKRVVSYAVPMVRIHLPPAASRVRTRPRLLVSGFRGRTAIFLPPTGSTVSGTETNNPTTVTSSTISGTWNVVLDQNDTSGVHQDVTFGGTFTITRSTCAGDFSVTEVNHTPTPSMLAFHVIFVNMGSEVRTISVIPGLYISYDTAKML